MINPWLSLWMSAANAWAGAARGFWTAEMQRQQTAMMTQMIDQTTQFWMQAWSGQVDPAAAAKREPRWHRSDPSQF